MRGGPTFTNYSNCQYNFKWNSAYLCESPDLVHLAYCFLRDGVDIYDLPLLTNNTLLQFPRNDSAEDFNISVCGNMTQCRGAFACDKENSYGKIFKSDPNGPQKLVTFCFQNEAFCKESPDLYDSVLKIWCKLWEGTAEIFLIREGECSAELQWVKENINNETDCSLGESITERDQYYDISIPAIIVMMSVLAGFLVIVVVIYCHRYGYRRTIITNHYLNRYRRVRKRSEQTDALPLEERS